MGGMPLEDFDGLAEFYVRKIEDYFEMTSDPQHLEETRPDVDEFCDKTRLKCFITDYQPRFWKIPPPK
ncbi:hypothetical protein LTS17_001828 [Exophiala oligosperma]